MATQLAHSATASVADLQQVSSNEPAAGARSHVALGTMAMALWLLVFAAGVSVDSTPYRNVLSPPRSAATADAAAGQPPAPADRAGITLTAKLAAFAGVMAFFTPLNVALLTILAGLVGGCASRITFARAQSDGVQTEPGGAKEASVIFRTEPPSASLLRSFLVYLAFIAGIFITTNDPFGSPTPDQYVRLAGLLSFVSFVVGYDPTRFQEFLSLTPRGGAKR